MEIKRITGTPIIPAETTIPEVRQPPPTSRGIANTSDSFEANAQRDQFSFTDNRMQPAIPQKMNPNADLLLEFQRRQFSTGNFATTEVNRAAQMPAQISEKQTDEITKAITDFVRDSGASSSDEIAAALKAAANTVAVIPYVGPIVAAILAVIAAILLQIGQMVEKQKEQQDASKEKKTGVKTVPEKEDSEAVLKRFVATLQETLKPADDDDDRD